MYDDGARLSSPRAIRSFYAALAPFAAACFGLALATDLATWATASDLWETMSVWLLTAGLVVGTLAILAAFVDLVRGRARRGRGEPWPTILGQAVAFGLSIVNVFVHSRDGYTSVVPQGLALSALVVLVLVVSAFLGRSTALRTQGGLV